MTHERESRPGGDTRAALKSGRDCDQPTAIYRQLRARRAASRRLPALASGRSDPWCYDPPIQGYAEAAQHLLDHGLTPAPDLPAMRLMWQHGGEEQRLAIRIAELWEVA